MFFLYMLVIALIGMFLYVLKKEPRSLWSGIALTGVVFSVLLIVATIYIRYSEWINNHLVLSCLVFFLSCIVVVVLLLSPLIFVLTYILEGIKLLRREGMRFTNMLSLLFSVGIIIYAFFMPYLASFSLNGPIRFFFLFIDFVVMYLFLLFTIFFLSEFVNLHHIIKRKKLDYIVILGCGVNGEEITPLLRGRVEKGLSVFRYNPHAKLILSGGQGPGEYISEAECMKRYAIMQGIDSSRIILEDHSRNTEENLIFSVQKMDIQNPRIAIVTNSFHVFRSLVIARKLNIPCIGYGSRTKMYFSLNARIREFAGYLKITGRNHLIVFLCYAIFLFLWFLLNL